MSDRLRVLPWIGGGTKDFPNAAISPLVSPVDESVVKPSENAYPKPKKAPAPKHHKKAAEAPAQQ